MDGLEQILKRLPEDLAWGLRRLTPGQREQVEEIRLKVGEHPFVYLAGREYECPGRSNFRLTNSLLNDIFHSILQHSAYAYQEELTKGYVTIEGGHRAGVCGRVVTEKGEVCAIKEISSLNLRRSREILGVSDGILPYLAEKGPRFRNTLLISPPKCGKTTLLRDIIRNLSELGLRVGVCDERSEIAGMYRGEAGFDLGCRSDVLDACPKDKAMIMLIRAMSPDVVATDEIGRAEDVEALRAAVSAGVALLSTVHGSGYADLLRSGVGGLVADGLFERLVFLSNRPSIGTVTEITDGAGRRIR